MVITYTPVINGVEPAEERVFALRTDPLQFEMFSCNAFLNMRLEWQAPLLSCTEGFDRTVTAAGGTLTSSARQSSVAGELGDVGWTSPEARLPGAFVDHQSYRQGRGERHLCQ